MAKGERWDFDPSELPIIRVYVPLLDAWLASGFGTAGFVRQHPDGDVYNALFVIDSVSGGLQTVIGQGKERLSKFEETLEEVRRNVPPFEEGSAEMASAFIWGSYTLGEVAHGPWPPELDRLYMRGVPRPRGDKRQWREAFFGKDGLVPRQLIEFLVAHPPGKEQPEDTAQPILTTMIFQVLDPVFAAQKIQARKHDFLPAARGGKGQVGFDWYFEPGGGSSLLWTPERRVPVGTLTFEGGHLQVETAALHLAARLVSILEQEARIDMRLVGVRWDDPMELMQNLQEPSLIVKP